MDGLTHDGRRTRGYLPIASYGLIGDCRSAALVGADGSIDWLCLPRFDDPSIFGRILDARRGGYWQVVPEGPYRVVQRYRDRSNILETIFSSDSGRVVVTDFMPTSEATIRHHARPHRDPRVVRILECVSGRMTMRQTIRPEPGYGAENVEFQAMAHRYHGDTASMHICVEATTTLNGPTARWRMGAGDAIALGLRSDERRRGGSDRSTWTVESARSLLRTTQEFWWRWIDRMRYDGPFQEPVTRSALALKLMTYAPTGAIVAAPTTSLPELVGGARNWDYRFTWLRDASFTLYAFFQIGMTDEAHDFFRWLMRIGLGRRGGDVANLYTLDGETRADEHELTHLSGYRGSRPVRVGNAAIHQLQLDVYGELLDSAYLYARFGGTITRPLWRELHAVVELAIDRWQLPDASIWESRGEPRRHTYSTLMCWVAVDRGLRLATRFGLRHDRQRWMRARRQIHRAVTTRGWSDEVQSFTQSLDGTELDAAVLRISQVRFLRDGDPRIMSTIDTIRRRLGDGVLLRRYDTEAAGGDGLAGGEGGFLLCSFWLVDALAHSGDLESAQRWFEKLLSFASPLGLYAEESDLQSADLLGNFPQAFTHLALIGAAVNMERARHRELGIHGLRRYHRSH